jgi:hypothetical protein
MFNTLKHDFLPITEKRPPKEPLFSIMIQLGPDPKCTVLSAEVIVHDRCGINTQAVQHTGNGL